jgi:hypothetical protein
MTLVSHEMGGTQPRRICPLTARAEYAGRAAAPSDRQLLDGLRRSDDRNALELLKVQQVRIT